jgi:hypothetical protein
MLGFYLAPIPIMVYLRQRADSSLRASLGASAGVIYAVAGAIGAVILASSVPRSSSRAATLPAPCSPQSGISST